VIATAGSAAIVSHLGVEWGVPPRIGFAAQGLGGIEARGKPPRPAP
jgi:hypothetical protein